MRGEWVEINTPEQWREYNMRFEFPGPGTYFALYFGNNVKQLLTADQVIRRIDSEIETLQLLRRQSLALITHVAVVTNV